MKYLKACCLALFAVLALAATASAKIPLPEIHLDEGTSATATGELAGANIAKLETALGSPITANSVKLKLSVATKLASLGTYVATFLETKQTANKECWTAAPGKDEHIVVEGEWHLVDHDPGLKLGIVFLVPANFVILCGKPKELKVEFKVTV